jgi:DNA polymerase III subunit delta'
MERVEFLPSAPGEVPEIDRFGDVPHPREMLSLLGQEAAERQFLAGYSSGKLHHAFLLAGPEGTGKATFAYRAARFLFEAGAGETGDALFAAAPAQSLFVPATARATPLVAHDSHPDLAVLKRRYDSKTKRFRAEISVEETREALQLLTKTAAFGGWRVVIVDAADDLNTASANALLKTLEEPPAKAVFFLVVHQPGRLLPTIRSRCQKLDFAPLSAENLATLLRAFGRPVPDLPALEIGAEGSIRRALRQGAGGAAPMIRAVERALASLPRPSGKEIEAVTEPLRGGAEGLEALYDLMDEIERFLAREARARLALPQPHAAMADVAELWAKLTDEMRKVEALNLDRRAFAMRAMDELSTLVSGAKR